MKTGSAAQHILGLERAALDRWGAGDPGGYLETYDTEISYFDPVAPARVDGVEAMREYYRPWIGKIHIDRYEMLNPVVVVGGDMAVLSYNLVNFTRDGEGEKVLNRWNSTAVYQHRDGAWKIVHSHWSYTRPALAP